MKKEKCPSCESTEEIYVIPGGKLLCENCGHKWISNSAATKNQRKQMKEGVQ